MSSRVYAQVFIEVTEKAGVSIEKALSELSALEGLVREKSHEESASQKELRHVFQSPAFSEAERLGVLRALCQKAGASAGVERLLAVLIKNGRFDQLPEVVHQIERQLLERRGGLWGELVSAIPVKADLLEKIESALSQKIKKPVKLSAKVDAGLIAGMRVTLDGKTFDGSLRSQLDRLAQTA